MVEDRELMDGGLRLGFICGMPRSGTTWLARALAGHPEMATFGETDFWGRDFVVPSSDGVYDARSLRRVTTIQMSKDWQATTGDVRPLPGLPSGEYGRLVASAVRDAKGCRATLDPKRVFMAIATRVAQAIGKPIVVEKTPGHLLFLQRLQAAFPDAPIVVMSREPLGFMASLTHRRGEGLVAGCGPIRRCAYHPAITALLWRAYARALIPAIDARAANMLRVEYAELERDPVSAARRAAEHLGVSSTQWQIDTDRINSSFASSSRRTAPAAAPFWLRWLAPDECLRLYPDVRLQQPGFIVVVTSLLTLPLAAILFWWLYRPRATTPWRYLQRILRAGDRDRRGRTVRSQPCG